MDGTQVIRRPGGRTESNRKAVADAVLGMVAAGNLFFSAQDVADRSGVHRTTIRRRWPDRDSLLAEAMAEHTSRFSVDLSGDWETVVRRIAYGLRDFMSDPVEDALNRIIAVSASDAFTDLVHRHWIAIFDDLAKPLTAAQARGELAPDVDIPMTLAMLSSMILSWSVYARRPLSDALMDRLLEQAIRGLRR